GVRFGPPRARHVAERRSADGDEVDGEDQGVARGGPLVAVREVRGDDEGAAAADLHADEPLAPATDDLVQGEADRAAPVPRRVEPLTRGRRGTDVVDGHRVALGHGGAGALDVVDDLQLVDGSGGLERRYATRLALGEHLEVLGRQALPGDQVDGEHERVAGGGPLVAVREVRGDDQGAAAADLHADQPLAPATDDLAEAELGR